jgi:hypothetical protein
MVKCYQTEEEQKTYNRQHAIYWGKNNKERKYENNKKYYENNEEKIMEWRNQRITCDCGKIYTMTNKKRHEQSKIHKKLIEEKNNINI